MVATECVDRIATMKPRTGEFLPPKQSKVTQLAQLKAKQRQSVQLKPKQSKVTHLVHLNQHKQLIPGNFIRLNSI